MAQPLDAGFQDESGDRVVVDDQYAKRIGRADTFCHRRVHAPALRGMDACATSRVRASDVRHRLGRPESQGSVRYAPAAAGTVASLLTGVAGSIIVGITASAMNASAHQNVWP